ncbi:MAG: dipeptide ABC transporter ATP-binding protein [Candidatus Ventricola sp.]|nr:dipeptide ABC transporter ATP-binding protein [Candidatus Ventricola sp.]
MEKILEVKDLRLSFHTSNGNVRAVRGISFDLFKGETLAIVGESGSGKSVTSKSIIGINAANAIVESGEIIYKGEDLLKYSEEDFNRIRGNDLTMVFQDPLSSLDPIMKVGKQMTEATLLNNKTRRKNAKAEVERLKKHLTACMKQAGCADTSLTRENIARAMQLSAGTARAARQRAVEAVSQALPLFDAEPLDEKAVRSAVKRLIPLVEASIDPLALHKDSCESTFRTSMNVNLDRYFGGLRNNPREERRVARETEKRRRLKKGAPKVVPANLVDLELTRRNLKKTLTDLLAVSDPDSASDARPDYDSLAGEMLAHLERKQKEAETKVTKQEAYDRAIQIMRDVGIKEPERRFNQYPHEFSGGMRQRIVIAIAIAANPEILLCDEPTTALDVTIQAQILELINDIKKKRNLSVLFITHDLGVVANMADRVAVMYAGKIVEYGTVDDIFYDPKHPYTWALLSSMPSLDTKDKLEAIPGTRAYTDAIAQARLDSRARAAALRRAGDFAGLREERARLKAFIAEQRAQIRSAQNDQKNCIALYRKRREQEINVLYDEKERTAPPDAQPALAAERQARLKAAARENIITQIQMIFQDPIASLDPRMTVREIIAEGLRIQGISDPTYIDQKVFEMLERVGLVKEHAGRYPHEFSGGMRQRIVIAIAIVMNPELIIADEPVSALDVSIQAQVINLLNELREEMKLTILFIAHDLSVVKYFSDRIIVMYFGKIVEIAESDELFAHPLHAYTRSLLSAIPLPDPHYKKQRKRVTYVPEAEDAAGETPELREVTPGHFVRCTGAELARLTGKEAQ